MSGSADRLPRLLALVPYLLAPEVAAAVVRRLRAHVGTPGAAP